MSSVVSSLLRACAGTVVVGFVALGPAPATAAGTTSPQDALCEEARDHLAEDRPVRATELVAAARRATGQYSLCPEEALDAAQATRIAANALARASLEADEATPDWEYVRRNA